MYPEISWNRYCSCPGSISSSFLTPLSSDNWHTKNYKYLMCTNWWVRTHANIHDSIKIIDIFNSINKWMELVVYARSKIVFSILLYWQTKFLVIVLTKVSRNKLIEMHKVWNEPNTLYENKAHELLWRYVLEISTWQLRDTRKFDYLSLPQSDSHSEKIYICGNLKLPCLLLSIVLIYTLQYEKLHTNKCPCSRSSRRRSKSRSRSRSSNSRSTNSSSSSSIAWATVLWNNMCPVKTN